ncbi:MAG: hypothetical protein U5K74_07495 [Gemmatimonadaceae bacterium]|nr:hypothetical protein [Gemmatimonadaceae bacterium]
MSSTESASPAIPDREAGAPLSAAEEKAAIDAGDECGDEQL